MAAKMSLSVFALVNVLGCAVVLLSLSQDTCMALPIRRSPPLMVNLLADINGKFVTARPNDTVLANASSGADEDSRFYVTYPEFEKFQLESAHHRGNYLMIDELGFLTLSNHTNSTETDTHLWETLSSGSLSVYRTFLNETACFMAFDSNGDNLQACENITTSSPEARLSIHPVPLVW